jgi:hypothetical protein
MFCGLCGVNLLVPSVLREKHVRAKAQSWSHWRGERCRAFRRSDYVLARSRDCHGVATRFYSSLVSSPKGAQRLSASWMQYLRGSIEAECRIMTVRCRSLQDWDAPFRGRRSIAHFSLDLSLLLSVLHVQHGARCVACRLGRPSSPSIFITAFHPSSRVPQSSATRSSIP